MSLGAFGAIGAVSLLYAEESGVPLPVPGDVWVLFFASRLPASPWMWVAAWLFLIVCVTLGASNLYLISRRWGRRVVTGRAGRILHLTPTRMEFAERWCAKYGFWAQVFGRHVPGCRVPLTVVAGILRVPYPRFAAAIALSTAIWTGVLLGGFASIGPHFHRLAGAMPPTTPAIGVALAGLVIIGVALVRRYRRQRAVMLAAGAWR